MILARLKCVCGDGKEDDFRVGCVFKLGNNLAIDFYGPVVVDMSLGELQAKLALVLLCIKINLKGRAIR